MLKYRVKFFILGWNIVTLKILSKIARGIGTFLKIDQAILEGDRFGHFAHILVDGDLTKNIGDSLMVEHDEYENLSKFYRQASRHSNAKCRRNLKSHKPSNLYMGTTEGETK